MQFTDAVAVKLYLQVNNGRKLDDGVEFVNTWKKFELEKVTIRKYFLEYILKLHPIVALCHLKDACA